MTEVECWLDPENDPEPVDPLDHVPMTDVECWLRHGGLLQQLRLTALTI